MLCNFQNVDIVGWLGFMLGIVNFALLFWRGRVHLTLTSSIIPRPTLVHDGSGDFFTWNISNLSSFDVYILDIGFSSRKFPLLAKYFGDFRLFSMSNAADVKILGRSQAEPNIDATFPIKLNSRNSIVLATSDILKIADAHDEGCRYMFVSTACGYFCAIKVRAFKSVF